MLTVHIRISEFVAVTLLTIYTRMSCSRMLTVHIRISEFVAVTLLLSFPLGSLDTNFFVILLEGCKVLAGL